MSRLFVVLQYLLPQHWLGRAMYAVARVRIRWLKDLLIRVFVRAYRPCMDDACEPDPRRYASFSEFFTRALRPDARPLDPDPRRVLSPCDGTLSIAAELDGSELLQAKGHRFTLEALLAGDTDWTARLAGGSYATLYLAPYDYHRIHMPLSGRLCAAWHVPGRLFSVNRATVARVPGLFARNERVVCAFEGETGPFVLVLVGALFVGSMSTIWHGEIAPRHGKKGDRAAVRHLTPVTHAAAWQPRGAELGRFNMGSTVLLLLPPAMARWEPALVCGTSLRMGQPLASLAPR